MLATLDDLVGLGALPEDYETTEPRAVRGVWLLTSFSQQVVDHLQCETEEDVVELDGWNATKTAVISGIVANAAATALAYGLASNVDPYATPSGLMQGLLERRHYRAIDRCYRVRRGSSSILTERDTDTSFLTARYGDPDDEDGE